MTDATTLTDNYCVSQKEPVFSLQKGKNSYNNSLGFWVD